MTRLHLGSLAAWMVCCTILPAGGKPTSEATSVLQSEGQTAGASDRRAHLAAARVDSATPDVWWQSGYVRRGESWQPFEQVEPQNGAALQEYAARRAQARLTAGAQLKLADWCRDAGLRDQERAHLIQALSTGQALNPLALVRRLGYRPVGGRWYTETELKATQDELTRLGKEWKRLAPKLNPLASRLEGKPAVRSKALQELRTLTTRDVLPILEFALAARSEAAAKAVIATISDVDSYRASQSLARLAVVSPWGSVREAATENLKARPWEEFVPMMLGMLSLPIRASVEVTPIATEQPLRGRMVWRFLWSREGRTSFEVASSILIDDRFTTATAAPFALVNGGGSLGFAEQRRERPFRIALESLLVGDLVYGHFSAAEELDDRANQFNHSITELLTTVTAQKLGEDPTSWWDWWDSELTDTIPGPKETFVVSEQVQSIGVPRWYYPKSCLAAGTPVWTEAGLQPIESIKIGDRVLAKNIETGELRFSPVLLTTRRENASLTNIHVADETIAASAGHNFWISGRGWTRTNQLEDGMTAHTATGTATVRVEDAGRSDDVFNLVVDDAHTYFVGKSLLLGHDVLIPPPTDIVVPGLSPEVAER